MDETKTETLSIENDSNDAPPPEQKKLENEILICPECSSPLEIISLNEESNLFEFQCIKNNHNNNKMLITDYFNKIKKIKKLKNFEFRDQCEIHKNNYFTNYCFDCNYHLCNECLKAGNHISHKKSNILEIKPIEKELKIISEVIKAHKIELQRLYKEKEVKTKELNDELKNQKNKENDILKDKIKLFSIKNKVELELNTKKYISDIIEIKKRYEEEIKITKKKYKDKNNKVNNKYKLKVENEIINYNLKIEKLNMINKNKIESYQFDSKIEKSNSIIKVNENIFNIYNSYNNNYYNSININNILVSYTKNKSNNEKMINILGNDYDNIINMITNKYKENFCILEKKNAVKELENNIKEEKMKSKEISEINIELNKKNDKKEEEIIKLNDQIKELNEANDQLKIKLNKYQKYFKEIQELENFQLQNSIIDFDEDPCELLYRKKLVNEKENDNLLKNFEIYVGIKDNEGYLIYQENNYDLIVVRIIDNARIKDLVGHKSNIEVIKYYINKNNEKEEYILSCDSENFVIIWDINDNFCKKYTFQEKYKDKIVDSLILFNVFNKDYILLCSSNLNNNNEFSKLYELKDKIPFVKDIYNSNKIKNKHLIPWLYNNKYYIISICDIGISINNIFEDENYANLNENQEKGYYHGLLFDDNYLCVTDANNNYITIWDLIKKVIDKKISFNAKIGYELVQWNNKYSIIGCDSCMIVIDIKEGKEYTKILGKNDDILKLKKIKFKDIGECLVCCGGNNNIYIYTIGENSKLYDESDKSDDEDDDLFSSGRKKRNKRNSDDEDEDDEEEDSFKRRRSKRKKRNSDDEDEDDEEEDSFKRRRRKRKKRNSDDEDDDPFKRRSDDEDDKSSNSSYKSQERD